MIAGDHVGRLLVGRSRVGRPLTLTLMALIAFAGCNASDNSPEAQGPAVAQALKLEHECETCSMTVLEQPAPRGQLQYRDGSHLHFCSVGDLLAHLQAPSRHGQPRSIFVEKLTKDEDPAQHDKTEHTWIAADTAHYVVGMERSGVMGPPVLVYAAAADARAAANSHGGQVLNYDGLQRWFQTQQH